MSPDCFDKACKVRYQLHTGLLNTRCLALELLKFLLFSNMSSEQGHQLTRQSKWNLKEAAFNTLPSSSTGREEQHSWQALDGVCSGVLVEGCPSNQLSTNKWEDRCMKRRMFYPQIKTEHGSWDLNAHLWHKRLPILFFCKGKISSLCD